MCREAESWPYGRRKVLFGTDYPVLAFKRTLDEIDALQLNPEAKQLLLRDNALRVYGLMPKAK